MSSQAKRMWLHDEDNNIKILPYTTLDNIKIQPNINEDDFLEFEEDYRDVKNTINTNKNLADNAINSLDNRVTILEGLSSGGVSGPATHTADGLMSKEDKIKLDLIEDEANKYEIPKATTTSLGGIKVDGETTDIDEDGYLQILSGGGGASVIRALNDVHINAILDGDLLQYSQLERKWVNVSPAEALSNFNGSGTDVDYISFDDIIDLFNTEDITYYYDLDRQY